MKPYENLSLQDMPGEIWKDVPGWESYYQASNLGRIKSISRYSGSGKLLRTKILRQSPVTKGYLHVRLYRNGKVFATNPSRLVALAFIPNPNNKPCVDHIDTDKTNNITSNLQWVTPHENMLNPISLAHRKDTWSKKYPKTGKSPDRRFSQIIGIDTKSNVVKLYPSIKDTKKDGFNPKGVSRVCSKKRRTTNKWTFYYITDPEAKSYLPKEYQCP